MWWEYFLKIKCKRNISKVFLGPGSAGPCLAFWAHLSNLTHYAQLLVLKQTGPCTCCFLYPPSTWLHSFPPSLHSHFCSNVLSSNRSSLRAWYNEIPTAISCPSPCCVLQTSAFLIPKQISTCPSVVLILLDSEPHSSGFLVCLVHGLTSVNKVLAPVGTRWQCVDKWISREWVQGGPCWMPDIHSGGDS